MTTPDSRADDALISKEQLIQAMIDADIVDEECRDIAEEHDLFLMLFCDETITAANDLKEKAWKYDDLCK